jgi:peroxiredoxin
MKKVVVPGILVIVMVLIIFTGWKVNSAVNKESLKAAPQVGYIAPDFSLTDVNGKRVKLSDVYSKNKVTLINFWATWCPPCRGEIPELIKLYRKYAPQRLALLAVDLQEETEHVKSFAGKNKMKFTVLADTSGKVGDQYRIFSIPSTFILDRRGRIRDLIIGGAKLKTFEAKIQPLLREQ